MPRILRRKTAAPATSGGSDDPVQHQPTASEPAPNSGEPAARSRAPRRRRSRSSGSRKTAATSPPPTDEATAATSPPPTDEATAAPRRRTRRRPAAAAEPVAPPEPRAADLPAILARQTELLERQNTVLEWIAGAQERQGQLMEQLAAAPAPGDGAMPVSVGLRPRLGIFVDVPNIIYAAERSGVELDWGKVAEFLSAGRTVVRAMAYAPISDDPNTRVENERFVLPFLGHGYRIVTKPLKRFSDGGVKANFDVELAIDILILSDRLDVVALVSGDGDFRRLVEIVASRGVRVEVVAFGQSTAAELRAVADRYVDIAVYVPQLSVDKKTARASR